MKISYDRDIAKYAKDYSRQCLYKHNEENKKSGRYGENLYATSKLIKNFTVAMEEAIRLWDDEKHECHKTCGHYTALVHDRTFKVGCAVAVCRNLVIHGAVRPKGMLIVCNYAPGGNIEGRRPYVSGETCSECPDGKECLCGEAKDAKKSPTKKPTTTEKPASTKQTPKTTLKEVFTTTTTGKPKSTKNFVGTTIKPVYDAKNKSIPVSEDKKPKEKELVATTTVKPTYNGKNKKVSDDKIIKTTTTKEKLPKTTTLKPLYEPEGGETPGVKIPKVSEPVVVISKVVPVTEKETVLPTTTAKAEVFYKPTTTKVLVEKPKKDRKNEKKKGGKSDKIEKTTNDKNKKPDEVKPEFEFVQLENENRKTALMPEKSEKVEEDFNKTEDVGKNELTAEVKEPYVQRFVRVKVQFNFCGLK